MNTRNNVQSKRRARRRLAAWKDRPAVYQMNGMTITVCNPQLWREPVVRVEKNPV